MDIIFTDQQLTRIRDQAMVYQCACPAQVCVAIDQLRELHKLQLKCLDTTETDQEVHQLIKISAEKTHTEMEQCLKNILEVEGWDMQTLTMPENLQKRLIENS